MLLTDNDGEYMSKDIETNLKSKGIRLELTIAHIYTRTKWSSQTNEQNTNGVC